MKIFHYVPDDPRTVNRANNNGVPVVLESPSASVAKSVTKLAMSVNGHHKDPATGAKGRAGRMAAWSIRQSTDDADENGRLHSGNGRLTTNNGNQQWISNPQ